MENKREITVDEANKFAKLNNMKYFETSSKLNKGIDELFDYLNLQVINLRQKKKNVNNSVITLNNKKNKINRKCC